MYYTLTQWVLIFFIYCFLGWIWECCYVSAKEKRWVNRGFNHGPVIPIYGFGAIIILGVTLPFEDSLLHVYFLGLLGASILEYITGVCMEKIFHVRYWDYSDHKFNLNGHISLFVSLGWGIFSLLLVKVIHPPVANIIAKIPTLWTGPISLLLSITMLIDFSLSIQKALDVKKLVKQITENNKMIVLLEDKLKEITISVSQTSQELQEYIQQLETVLQENISSLQAKAEIRKQSLKAVVTSNIQQHKNKKFHLLDRLEEKIDKVRSELQVKEIHLSNSKKLVMTNYIKDLEELKAKLKLARLSIHSQKDKKYYAAASLIRRNPRSASRRFKKAFDEIKALNEWKK